MKRASKTPLGPISIHTGPCDWQVLQQDADGVASVKLAGVWATIMKQKSPQVRVRVVREGCFSAISKDHDWVRARTVRDRSAKGALAGKRGTWSITLKDLPCGGPYRIDTCIGSAGDALEWRRGGEGVHFLCVGDVWLIAGQSNAEGYGRDPVDDPSELGVHAFEDGVWQLAAHGRMHHPWLAFGKHIKQDLGTPIGLIPTAVGGSALSQWDPGQKGELYARMKAAVQDSGGRIRGCVWYQGESDTGAADHPKYRQRFARFVKGLRALVKRPELPLITVQLNRVLGPREDGGGWEAMREVQRALPHEMEHVFVIPIFDAGLCDGIHISSLGNLLVAQRAADTALGGVYGRPIHFQHPECVSARKVSKQAVELRFDHVVERLDFERSLSNGFPFLVRDAEGEVPVASFRMPSRNVFRMAFTRPLAGAATVTGAPGLCPPQTVPRDINGYRAMLGFTREID